MSDKRTLIKGAKIVDPQSPYNGKTTDILIEGSIISDISDAIKAEGNVVDGSGCILTPGLLDLRAHIKDPGKEYKEDIHSACSAAAAGGFTAIAAHPNTNPVLQDKSGITYLLGKSSMELTEIIPIGASTVDLKSEEITEMYDMYTSGARAFSNADKAYKNSSVLLRALMYNRSFDGLVMSHSEDHSLAADGSVNESETTISTGLKKRTSLAEFLQIRKEIELARYSHGRIHFSHISTAEAVEAIRAAKKDGLKVTCDVSIWNLVYTDQEVLTYDTNYKFTPPLRSTSDIEALIGGLNDGTIDAIVSDHNPQNIERKKVEFDFAAAGSASLQTLYSLYNQHLRGNVDEELFVKLCSHNPRHILKTQSTKIDIGEEANLALFDPECSWVLTDQSNFSRSENTPLWGQELKGKCLYIRRADRELTF